MIMIFVAVVLYFKYLLIIFMSHYKHSCDVNPERFFFFTTSVCFAHSF